MPCPRERAGHPTLLRFQVGVFVSAGFEEESDGFDLARSWLGRAWFDGTLSVTVSFIAIAAGNEVGFEISAEDAMPETVNEEASGVSFPGPGPLPG